MLLYGVGSKIGLLESFAKEELTKHGTVVIIRGYEKDLNLKEVL